MTKNNQEGYIRFAGTEREKIREHFRARAANPPVPRVVFGYDAEWEAYCEEMRSIEAALRECGEDF